MRAPTSFELGNGGIRMNSVGELHHNLPSGESARMLFNVGTEETISELIGDRKFDLYPSLTLEKDYTSIEFKPLQGSMSFTAAYPLAGGKLAYKKETNGASTLIFRKESLEITAQRNFFGIGGKVGEVLGIPIITYFGYGSGEGLGHMH